MDTYNHQNNMNSNNAKKEDKWGVSITIAIVAIIVGLLLGYAIFGNKLEDADVVITSADDNFATSTEVNTIITETKEDNTAKVLDTKPITGDMSLDAPDQLVGSRVKLTSLKLSEPAWVVTFNSNETGDAPFKIIGAQYFNQGTYTDITAYIAEPTIASAKYFVALYADDGAVDSSGAKNHVFNHVTDKPFVRNGNWIIDSFTAQEITTN